MDDKFCGDCGTMLSICGLMCDENPTKADEETKQTVRPYRCEDCHFLACTDQNHPEDCETVVFF